MTTAQQSHVQYITEECAQFHAKHNMPDHFPPSLNPETDGELICQMNSRCISYYYTTKVFIKRQPHADEMGMDGYGKPVVIPYIADRIRNEAAALRFIAAHTSIPVPRLLGLDEEHGLVFLKTSFVDRGVTLDSLDAATRPAATAAVERQLQEDILPQLRGLRRNFMGSADPQLPVIPPHRLWRFKESRVWPALPCATDEYVFCHTDLNAANIFVDPTTYKIVSIIDWETAGFFPPEWERPYWTARDHCERSQITEAAKAEELALFEVENY
ncbi:Protein kinase-like domain protein [Niveomyces insectorum RCEF 264]|uniref:Protein kinase-like domain protein n=1 Tax=Niveomyces insectorum RCEF 264 TaxID=1081102 RepID=A0A167QR98_9HYPO|nr:Protein kinase-like domain protein [Niveomyces insectorum RCEF 264]